MLSQGARIRSELRDGALGIAFGSGPFYNLTWREHGEEEADAATRTGFEHIEMRAHARRKARPTLKIAW